MARVLSLVIAVAALVLPTTASAQRRDLAHGRGLAWGVSGIVPVVLTTVRYVEAPSLAAVLAPGGGVEARVGIELDSGLTLEVAASIDGHAVDQATALARYRAGAQLRMPFDVGGDVFPYVGVGAGLALFSHDKRFDPTFDVRGIVGASWWLEPWFALDLHVVVDVAAPGFAFTDTVVVLTPEVGVAISY